MCRFCRRAVTGIEDVVQVGEDVDHRLAAGQRLMAQMIEPAAFGVSGHERFGDFRQFFFETNVGSHRTILGRRRISSPV